MRRAAFVPAGMRSADARRLLSDLGTQILREHRKALDDAGKPTQQLPKEVRVDAKYATSIDTSPSNGWIYIVKVADNLVKIGHAKDVRRRLKHLQVSCPDVLFLVSQHRVPAGCAAINAEREIHAALWTHHYRGEWFMVSTTEATTTAERVLEAIANRLESAKCRA